jgi:hypothetical protein
MPGGTDEAKKSALEVLRSKLMGLATFTLQAPLSPDNALPPAPAAGRGGRGRSIF